MQAYEAIGLLCNLIWRTSFLSSHHSNYESYRRRLQHAYVDSPSSWLGFLGVIKIGMISVSFSLSLHCGWLGAGYLLAYRCRGTSLIVTVTIADAPDRLATTTQRACFTALVLSALPSSIPFRLRYSDFSFLILSLGPNSVFSKLLRVYVTVR